jgi:hypothetical protein
MKHGFMNIKSKRKWILHNRFKNFAETEKVRAGQVGRESRVDGFY